MKVYEDKSSAWLDDIRREMLRMQDGTEEWISFYGPVSPKLHQGEYVQYESRRDGSIMMSLVQTGTSPFLATRLSLMREDDGKLYVTLTFEIEQKKYSLGQGVVDYKYRNYVIVDRKSLKEYFEAMSSFDSFMNAAHVELMVNDESIPGEQLVEENPDAIFGNDNVERYTAYEILKRCYDDYDRFMEGLDYGLREVNSSFEDAGISY